jgi:hypothetical protein
LSDKVLVWESLGSSSESEEIEIFELEAEDEALEREAEEEDLVEESDGPGFFAPDSVFFCFPRLDLGLSEAARVCSLGFGTLFEVLRDDAIERDWKTGSRKRRRSPQVRTI